MPFAERKDAYDAEITYGTNSEFGFDYLRDNMAVSLDGVVQRGHPYGIVDGVARFERALGIENLYDPRHSQLVNHMIQALKAQSLFLRDRDYVVQDGEVKIVDEFTGRIMEGRRWSEGLHQAVEAQEGVAIQ